MPTTVPTPYDPAADLPRSAAMTRVFGTRAFFRLWLSQLTSSLGDWIGLIAILAIAARVSDNSGAAVSLVMLARVVPGFFLATVGGVIVDRFDRRKVIVISDVGRAGLLVALPFVDTLGGLVLVSFAMEVFSLLYGPAKDASVPNLVPETRLASANSLGLVAAYGTFPFASIAFSLLTILATWLGGFDALSALEFNTETLALWLDAVTFIVSAALVWRLPLPARVRGPDRQIDLTSTVREMVEGFHFIRRERVVRAVIVGLGIGLIGGGAMIPLGPVFASEVLGGDAATFGLLMTALGIGASVGIVTLLAVQRKLPRQSVFSATVMLTGLAIVLAASFSNTLLAALFAALTGAFAGSGYVTGFSLLQEEVADELRGRTFAALYSVIRLCLLISLTVSPLFSDLFEWLTGLAFADHEIELAGAAYTVNGVRATLWAGGLLTFVAGVWTRRAVRQAHEAVERERA